MGNLKVKAAIRAALAAVLLVGIAGCVTTVADETFTFREPVRVSRDQLRTDGYYCTRRHFDDSDPYDTGTALQCYIVWQDGTALRFSQIGKVKHSELGKTVWGTLEEAHQHFQNYVDSLSAQPSWGKRARWPRWGAYRIRGDSISIQISSSEAGFVWTYFASNEQGEVLNDTTFVLEEVYHAEPCADDTTTAYCRGTYHFHPWNEKPDSTNWLHERYR